MNESNDIRRLQRRIDALESENRRLRELAAPPAAGPPLETDFLDIVGVEVLQGLLARFFELTGIPVGIVGLDDAVLVAAGWPEARAPWQPSGRRPIAATAQPPAPSRQPETGLWNVAIAIVVDDTQTATLHVGPFRYADDAAQTPSADPAADAPPPPALSRERVAAATAYFTRFARMLGDIGTANQQLKREIIGRRRIEQQLHEANQTLNDRIAERTDALRVFSEKVMADADRYYETAQDLAKRLELEKAAIDISTAFIGMGAGEIDGAINDALGRIGRFSGVDRSYVFLYSPDAAAAANTHEWCRSGVPAQKAQLQQVSMARYAWFQRQIAAGETVHVPRIADLPEEAASERARWQAEGLCSVIALPLRMAGRVAGFIGFETVTGEKAWGDEDRSLLRIVGDIISRAIQHRIDQQALLDSEQRFRLLVEHSSDAIYLSDNDGRLVDVNRAACRTLGYRRADLLGMSVADVDARHDLRRARAVWQDLAEGNHVILETEHRRRDGGVLPVEVNITAFPYGDRTLILGMARDITERKQSEARLAAAMAELERSNAELEQFAYVASHDLQEPLRAVAGFLQLLQKRFAGRLDDKADEYIGRAVAAADRMRRLINDLLAFSRVGSKTLNTRPVDADAVLDTVIEGLQPVIEAETAVIHRDPLPVIEADADQVTRLFDNLLSNALKYRSAAAPEIRITAEEAPDAACIRFTDNGIGIDPRFYDRIFQVFQRLHTRDAYPGTGIGLAVCKKIMERHGGSISVDSGEGAGASFTVRFPKRKGA